jgi:hypothetical protein
MDEETLHIKQTSCPLCRNVLDFHEENEVLVKCVSCQTIYHQECWKALASCSNCRKKKMVEVDKSFFIINILGNNSEE